MQRKYEATVSILLNLLINLKQKKKTFFCREHQSEINFIQNMSWSDDINDEMVDTTNKDYMRICPGHEVSFSIESTIHELDIPEENIATLLCYMELHEQRYIQVLSKAYSMCKVVSYGGAKSIKYVLKSIENREKIA